MLRRISIGAAAVAVAVGGLLAPSAGAATNPNSVANLVQELHSGTLSASHGVKKICGPHGRCMGEVLTTAPGSNTPLSTTAPVGYGPADLAAAFHLPAGNVGQHGTIAIIDAGAYPTLEADLATYRATYGLPLCDVQNDCLKIADYHGGGPLAPATDDTGKIEEEEVAGETSLDVDMASAACPGCEIVEVQVPLADAFPGSAAAEDTATADFATAVTTAISMGANSVSISYGYDVDSADSTGLTAKQLDDPGVAIVASSGDSGFAGNFPSWPAALDTVTAAGGISLYPNSSGKGYSQTAWNGAGAGCAATLPPAIGQPKSVAANCGGHRAYADVSAVADPSTGVAVFDTWAPSSGAPADWQFGGGTSASSPYIAGLYARGGKLSTVHGPNTAYSSARKNFTDVTLGQVEPAGFCAEFSAKAPVCVSGAGWDGPTGLGTPNGLGAF
jgi:subtilase family serine protease